MPVEALYYMAQKLACIWTMRYAGSPDSHRSGIAVRKRHAPEVQNLLAALKAKMAVKGAASESIVSTFIKQHADAIARENFDLVHIALMKLVGHVGAVRSGGATAAQLEMFAEFAVPKTVLFRSANGSKIQIRPKIVMI